ncbi:uncharacterized protein N7525_006176 [Penicillium rubens]|uniref:uncharacterized protein n=1 Tax=Penicillium rubens TaxID=1108849 RepID=UPI002A5A4E7B|nr:uncharacterized protein N7525_006176 [Penicillium rubens]KAJ5840988.1 hypothetical protein N7525_006176 [Penicillium rubens]
MLNDFIILVTPFPRIAQFQITLRKKLAICGIMAVGILRDLDDGTRIHLVNNRTIGRGGLCMSAPSCTACSTRPSINIIEISFTEDHRHFFSKRRVAQWFGV